MTDMDGVTNPLSRVRYPLFDTGTKYEDVTPMAGTIAALEEGKER